MWFLIIFSFKLLFFIVYLHIVYYFIQNKLVDYFNFHCILFDRGITRRLVMVPIFRTLHLTITRSAEGETRRTWQNSEIFSRNTSMALDSFIVMSQT